MVSIITVSILPSNERQSWIAIHHAIAAKLLHEHGACTVVALAKTAAAIQLGSIRCILSKAKYYAQTSCFCVGWRSGLADEFVAAARKIRGNPNALSFS
jgi:hypothetical protein